MVSSFISLLIFCLVALSIFEREVLKFSTVIVRLSVCPFSSVSFCFTCVIVHLLGMYTFRIAMSS